MVCAHSSGKSAAAFTLVEMLVSVAVLILIMVFVSQMMNSTLLSTTASGKHEDADGQLPGKHPAMKDRFHELLPACSEGEVVSPLQRQ